MLKQKFKNLASYKKLPGALVLSILIVGSIFLGVANADQFDDQINSLNAQNAAGQAVANQLAAQASSYQTAVDALSSQIASIRQGILDNQKKSDDLQNQIDQEQTELTTQKQILGENIKTMYLEGQISTIEMLAASKNLNEFVDKQQYHNSVQNKITTTVDKITALKLELEQQQRVVQGLINDEEKQQADLDGKLSQQNSMLSYTESQKADYDSLIKRNNATIASLRAQQAAAYASYIHRGGISSYGVGEPGNGGYPSVWAFSTQDTITDSWGMYNRECVSYVAWKVDSIGHYMPWWGNEDANAYNWINLANSYHIANGTRPAQNSVVVWEHNDGMGWLGHVAFVESVNPDGSIEVSQYNVIHGQFSRMHVDAGTAASLHYIYF